MNRWEQEISKYSLEEEKEILERLRDIYEQASEDVRQKISELATLISENPENLQSLIYQKRYQEMIQNQINDALNGLDSVTYETIHKYLEDCYRTGFVGSIYDFHHQGIPLVVPIQQKDIVRALIVDSKLSKGLYTRLGEDVNKLKKAVQVEVSRGIAQGLYWNDIAKNLSVQMINSPVKTAMNNSMRIARTEGHRVQVQGQLDACKEAKDKGADVVKQWDSTLDERTRDTHRELHGQIREYNENFIIPSTKQEAFAPSMFGIAEEDINCRCALLQRARWMLDDDELKFLEDSARQLGLVDEAGNVISNSFREFKIRYLTVTESGAITGALNNKNDPNRTKRETHAEEYYQSVRNSNKQIIISTISKNAKIDEAIVSKMINHVFFQKHHLSDGYKYFDSDYDISQSVQRLRLGENIQSHDITLIYHESMESDLMSNLGLSYNEAHKITNETYNYQIELREWKGEDT